MTLASMRRDLGHLIAPGMSLGELRDCLGDVEAELTGFDEDLRIIEGITELPPLAEKYLKAWGIGGLRATFGERLGNVDEDLMGLDVLIERHGRKKLAKRR